MGRKNYSRFFSEEKLNNDTYHEEPKTPKEYKEEVSVSEPVAKTGKVINCEMVNVRSKAAPNAPISSIIQVEEEVEVFEDRSTKDYYAVKTKLGIDGFIKKDFIEV